MNEDDGASAEFISLEWLREKVDQYVLTGKRPTDSMLQRHLLELDLLARRYQKGRHTSARAYPLQSAAEVLHRGAGVALAHWTEQFDRNPNNQRAIDAIRELGDLVRIIDRGIVGYMEMSRPPNYDVPRLEIARQLGQDPKRVKRTPTDPNEFLADQVAAIFERILRDAGQKRVGTSTTGPLANLTAEVMRRAGWTEVTPAGVSQRLKRMIRNNRMSPLVPDQNSSS